MTTTANADTLVVSEVFGPTLQGEGPSLGRRATFVRLGGCNLHCTWCDTPYTWDASRYDLRAELNRRSVAEIAAQVRATGAYVTVLTGGEPLLWQDKPAWSALLYAIGGHIEVETNGTIEPNPHLPVARYNCSPKLAHAGDPESERINPPALRKFADLAQRDRAILKVVVSSGDDVSAAAALAHQHGFPLRHVYVMPEGTSAAAMHMAHGWLADAAIAEGLNMTTRLHVLAWGAERGR